MHTFPVTNDAMTIPGHIIQKLDALYVVCVLMLSSHAFTTLFVGGSDRTTVASGSPVFTVTWGLIYIVTLVRIAKRRDRLASLVRANRPLICLVFLTLASVLWSIDPRTTFHGFVTLLFGTFFAADMCFRYSPGRQIQLIATAMGIVIAASVVAETMLPGFIPGSEAEMDLGGGWHGVFGFKNEFGRAVCLGVIAYLMTPRQPKWTRVLIVIAGVALTALSNSKSSVGYLAILVLLSIGWGMLRWRPKPRKVTLALCGIVALASTVYVSQNFARAASMLGKDPHLNGRVDLWRLSLDDIRKRPLLGYGYEAFWTPTSQPARMIREEVHWDDAPHSHNGYIEISLSLGLAGLCTYLAGYISIAKRAYRQFVATGSLTDKWALTLLLFVFAYQFTESSIVVGGYIGWLLYCCVAFSLSIEEARTGAANEPARLAAAA